jgi:PST family polysaccharide transporter
MDRVSSRPDAEATAVNLKERSIRGGLSIMLYQATDSFVRIAAIILLARILVPEDFGLVSMVTAITAIAEQFKDFGLSKATVQNKLITDAELSNLFWINSLTGVCITIFLCGLSFVIAAFFQEPRLVYVTIVIATGFLWSGATIQHQAILQREMQYAAIGGVQLSATLMSVALATMLALTGYGYWALVWRDVSRNVFVALGTWLWCPWRPRLPRTSTPIGHLLRFGRDITGFNLIVMLTANLDQVLIGKLYGASQLGIYRQASNLIFWPVMQLMIPMSRVAERSLSYLQDDRERYSIFYRKLLTTMNFIMMPAILFAVVYAEELVTVVLGQKWMAAAPILRVLALAAIVTPSSVSIDVLLVACGKTKRYLNLGVATGLVLLLAFSVGVLWGAIGVAYGYLVAAYTLHLVRLCYGFGGTPVTLRTFFQAVETPLVASGAMAVVLLVADTLVSPSTPLSALIVGAPICLVTYLAAWIVLPGGKAQLAELLHDFRTSLSRDRRRRVVTT